MGEAFNVNEETIEMGYVNRDKGDTVYVHLEKENRLQQS